MKFIACARRAGGHARTMKRYGHEKQKFPPRRRARQLAVGIEMERGDGAGGGQRRVPRVGGWGGGLGTPRDGGHRGAGAGRAGGSVSGGGGAGRTWQ